MSGRVSVALLVIAMVSSHATENRTKQIARHVGASRTPTTTCSNLSVAPQSHAAARIPLQLLPHQHSSTVALAWFMFIIVQSPHQLDTQCEYTTLCDHTRLLVVDRQKMRTKIEAQCYAARFKAGGRTYHLLPTSFPLTAIHVLPTTGPSSTRSIVYILHYL